MMGNKNKNPDKPKKLPKKDDNQEDGITEEAATEDQRKKTKLSSTDSDDTIFIRNLSYETEEDTLKKFFEENFGPTTYCLICRNKETDESKGTAFVKFKESSVAKKCLEEFKDRDLQAKFHLEGRNLMIMQAMSRDQVKEVNVKDSKKKDKRNLALSREGFIHHMSEEAKDLSKSDLEKRKALDSRKRTLLKNLHNFVSDTRLCIHNLPPSVDDRKLKEIFINSINSRFPEAKIVECRVMRNKKGATGKLRSSKGFGFVAFSKHEHSLAALKALNNNPKIFNRDKRPIVEFSIENMVALNKKKTRLVNSQRKLQQIREKAEKPEAEVAPKKIKKFNKIKNKT